MHAGMHARQTTWHTHAHAPTPCTPTHTQSRGAADAGRAAGVDDAGPRAVLLAWALLAVLFLASAQLVSFYEGAPAGPIERSAAPPSPAPQAPAAAPAFTLAHGIAARQHVERLAAMGVKVAGNTQTEQAAPGYILAVLDEVRAAAHADVRVEVAVQRPSGSFNTDFLGGINAVYQNVTNVVCRISRRTEARGTADALIINSHFDSAIGSPGAADDLSQVGIASLNPT